MKPIKQWVPYLVFLISGLLKNLITFQIGGVISWLMACLYERLKKSNGLKIWKPRVDQTLAKIGLQDILRHHTVRVEKRAIQGDVVGHHILPTLMIIVKEGQNPVFQFGVKIFNINLPGCFGIVLQNTLSRTDAPSC